MATVAPTYAEFVVAYPEFARTATPVVERHLAFSERLLEASAWGDFYSDAVGLDAAHNLTLLQLAASGGTNGALQGAMGPVTSVSAAGISTSFATLAAQGKHASVDWYNKTVYGQMFLRLRNTVIAPAAMACDLLGAAVVAELADL